MSRERFSDYVLRDYHRSHLSQTAEEIAEALQIPLHKLLERTRRAGIVLSRDTTPLQEAAQRNAKRVWDTATRPRQNTYNRVAEHVVEASIASPRSSVVDMGFRNPFER